MDTSPQATRRHHLSKSEPLAWSASYASKRILGNQEPNTPMVNQAAAPFYTRRLPIIEVSFGLRRKPGGLLLYCFREEYAIWRTQEIGPISGRSSAMNRVASCD